MASLIRVEDLRLAMPGECFFQRLRAELHVRGIGQAPRCIGMYVMSEHHT
jgi:hypothetical protein